MGYQDDCIFCLIAAHRAPAAILFEDEETVSFLDIHPIQRGHALVIPREHYVDIFDLSEHAAATVMRTVRRVAHALRAELQPDGMQLLQGSGRAAAQTVFHFHMHIVPRWYGNPIFQILVPRPEMQLAVLEPVAAAIRERL